jgi:hypothetical protein
MLPASRQSWQSPGLQLPTPSKHATVSSWHCTEKQWEWRWKMVSPFPFALHFEATVYFVAIARNFLYHLPFPGT